MIDYSQPYTVDWHVYKVNVDTWDESEELPGVVSVEVSRDCTDDVPLVETSTMSVDIPYPYEFDDGWYRVIANVLQDSTYMRVPITTQYYATSTDTIDYVNTQSHLGDSYIGFESVSTAQLNGRSVLLPASQAKMRDGSYVPKDSNGAEWCVRQLKLALKAPVGIIPGETGFSLKRHIVYDSNDTILSAVWSVLDAGKWCLTISGNGVVYLKPKPEDPSLIIDNEGSAILLPSVNRQKGTDGIPNRYIARYGGREVVMINDDPNSVTSTRNVGHYIDSDIDDNPYLVDGESIYNYVRRKLEEASTVSIVYDYQREYYPGIYPLDIIQFHLPYSGLMGDLRVIRQRLTLAEGITVSETASEERKYWRVTDNGRFA